MRRLYKRLIFALVIAAVAFVAVTWWALEADGVAIVQTARPDETVRATHVWYVQREGELLLEAGTPENGWFVDSGRDPSIVIVDPAAMAGRYTVEVLANPDGHARIRSWMHDKYGWRDRWIGRVFDTSRSIAVRLTPAITGGAQ